MSLRNRVNSLEQNATGTAPERPVIEMYADAINLWRSKQGLAPLTITRASLADTLRPLPVDTLLMIYREALTVGNRSDEWRELNTLSTDELRRRYVELIGY